MAAANAGSFDGFVLTVDTATLQPFDPLLTVYQPTPPSLNFRLFPNPSSGLIFLEAKGAIDAKVVVYDALGRCLQQHEHWQPYIDLSPYTSGIYLLTIQTKEQLITKRVVLR